LGLKVRFALTVDRELFDEIERLRGREKRSSFVEHLLRVGLRAYKEVVHSQDPRVSKRNVRKEV